MNPESLSTLFDSIDELDRLNVFEITLKREGPVLALRADLPRFPERPSKRWPPGANRVQVSIELLGVEGLSLSGFAPVNHGHLEVEPSLPGYAFSFHAQNLALSGRCSGLRIAGVSAYLEA
ncbi:immunity 50 family protein [Alcanivorax sp. JB21]|uniref:Imm50 family immunity protein n=1 Tax=Alcanivorax limicola TaxID=2874102 RepID=UPI001CC15CF8|nr:Imm50 family immunity protein [Alcanivorax limicola]MBZ2188826.1 immunity 50 family protein [Alcanivorax limicola]